jgi:FtsH-binding integral membrane protein
MNNTMYANPAIYAESSERAGFIRRTYAHLGLAILAFIIVEAFLLQLPIAGAIAATMTGGFAWLIVLAAFMGVSYLANRWAQSDASPQMQYAGLGLYIIAEAIIFLPLLYVVASYSSPQVIPTAGMITLFLFAGLTAVVFITQKDFSWMRSVLLVGSFIALGVIVASIIFGFTLGIIFSAIMVLFAAGAILYNTSEVLHHYRTDQHVAASLALFASIALLFWYVVQIVRGSDD